MPYLVNPIAINSCTSSSAGADAAVVVLTVSSVGNLVGWEAARALARRPEFHCTIGRTYRAKNDRITFDVCTLVLIPAKSAW